MYAAWMTGTDRPNSSLGFAGRAAAAAAAASPTRSPGFSGRAADTAAAAAAAVEAPRHA